MYLGGFIAIFVIGWMIWRAIKNKGKRRSVESSVASESTRQSRFYDRFTAKIPFVKRRQPSWPSLDDEPRAVGPKSVPVVPEYPVPSMSANEKEYFVAENQATDSQWQMPVQSPSQPVFDNSPSSVPARSGTINTVSSVSTYRPNDTYTNASVSVYSHQPADSLSSTNAALFMMAGSGPRTPANDSFRPPLPDKGLVPSPLSRQPSRPTDPTRRQMNRASELSSISSGFGDGDIVIPPPVPPLPQSYRPESSRYSQSVSGANAGFTGTATRSSWLSRKSFSNRDTVYTATSEDGPPRFRSVNSWVNQQTGRMKRAEKQKAVTTDPDAPPLPGMMPPEQNWGMMVDDGEVPRSPATMDNSTMSRR